MTDHEERTEQYLDAHENLARLAVEATDNWEGKGVRALDEIVRQAGDMSLLLALAIAVAEERALNGEVPDSRRSRPPARPSTRRGAAVPPCQSSTM